MDFLFLLYAFSGLNASVLKQFQLLWFRARLNGFCGEEYFHGPKLLVGYAKYAHVAVGGQKTFHALNMHIGILTTWAAPGID